jgi:hypothetical protein
MPRSWMFGPLIVASLLVMTGTEASAQGTRFRVDWLFLKRDTDGPQSSLISGPDAFDTDAGFDYESGYRLFGSVGTCDWDLEARFSRLEDWTDSTGAQLASQFDFDSQSGGGNNMLSLPNAIGFAAEYSSGMGVDETLGAEFLSPNSNALFHVQTVYNDFDITLKTSRLNRHRVGLGFRHIDFDENSGLRVQGAFNSVGDDGALTHEALVAAGLTAVSGAGGFADGDPMIVNYNTINDNNLNGLHLTYDVELVNYSIWVLDAYANIGIFHNRIRTRVSESYIGGINEDTVYAISDRGSENDIAGAGQIGFSGGVKLTDNWKFLAGYEAMFIDGLSLGIKFPPASGDESVFIHGGRIGFEGVW